MILSFQVRKLVSYTTSNLASCLSPNPLPQLNTYCRKVVFPFYVWIVFFEVSVIQDYKCNSFHFKFVFLPVFIYKGYALNLAVVYFLFSVQNLLQVFVFYFAFEFHFHSPIILRNFVLIYHKSF